MLKHIQQPSLVVAALIVGFLSAIAVGAVADGDPTTDDVPRTLPYMGVLEIDGQPLNATGADALNIMFMLYDGQASETPVYRQTMRIDVYGGRFTTTIGPLGLGENDEEVIISDIITNADDLYLGMTLLGDLQDPDDDVQLANRQRIHATPYAMWATSATNLAVANNAIVGGGVTVGGDLTVGGDVALPAGAIDSDEVADGALLYEDFNAAIAGEGLFAGAEALELDGAWVDDRIRTWVRNHCYAQLGWRDGCNNCGSAPAKRITARADGTCDSPVGSDTSCRANGTWAGVNTDGTVDGNDVFYIRFVCD